MAIRYFCFSLTQYC